MEMWSDVSVTWRVEKASGSLLICRKCAPGAVPNVEHVHNMMAFIHGANDSVDVRLLSKKDVAKLLVFRDERAAAGKSLQTINCLTRRFEPSERMLGSIRFDVDVDCFHVSQAAGQPNEVFHGCGGTFAEIHAPDGRGPSLGPQALGGFPQRHRLVPRCRGGADRLQHPARPLPLCR